VPLEIVQHALVYVAVSYVLDNNELRNLICNSFCIVSKVLECRLIWTVHWTSLEGILLIYYNATFVDSVANELSYATNSLMNSMLMLSIVIDLQYHPH